MRQPRHPARPIRYFSIFACAGFGGALIGEIFASWYGAPDTFAYLLVGALVGCATAGIMTLSYRRKTE